MEIDNPLSYSEEVYEGPNTKAQEMKYFNSWREKKMVLLLCFLSP